MKKSVSIVTLVLMGGLLVFSPAQAETLKQQSMDDLSSMGVKIEVDEEVKKEGDASVRIESAWGTTICVGQFEDMDVENAKLVYKADIKSELDGDVLLEMWVHFGARKFFSRGFAHVVKGKSDWTTSEAEFLLKEGQNPDKVTLNVMTSGPGKVWVDNVRLEKEPLEEPAAEAKPAEAKPAGE